MIASEAVPRTASTRPDGKLALSLYLESGIVCPFGKISILRECVETGEASTRTQLSFFRRGVLLSSVRNVARFGGEASDLGGIAGWKCTLQFLIQLPIEFFLFSLCGSVSWGHHGPPFVSYTGHCGLGLRLMLVSLLRGASSSNAVPHRHGTPGSVAPAHHQ